MSDRHIEICACGHPSGEHAWEGCRVDRSNCNCKKIRGLFVVKNAASFYQPHVSTGVGHALIQGLMKCDESVESIQLCGRDLGKLPECYRCRRFTSSLTPVLVNRHSMKAVSEVSQGRMTRLWCDRCCELEEIDFFPHVAIVIRLAWERGQISN